SAIRARLTRPPTTAGRAAMLRPQRPAKGLMRKNRPPPAPRPPPTADPPADRPAHPFRPGRTRPRRMMTDLPLLERNRGFSMKPAITLLSIATLIVTACTAVSAGDPLPAATERFAGTTDEVPDFQRHLVPLLGKLGCNGRACHGSFQRQAGFRLSLFGYDFAMDHEGLSHRDDTDDPAASYALEQAT